MNDLIDRQAAIYALIIIMHDETATHNGWIDPYYVIERLKYMPSAEPEIIYCKDCRKHNKGAYEVQYLTDKCPLISHRGYAQGHEFDYQFCSYAERRDDDIGKSIT